MAGLDLQLYADLRITGAVGTVYSREYESRELSPHNPIPLMVPSQPFQKRHVHAGRWLILPVSVSWWQLQSPYTIKGANQQG